MEPILELEESFLQVEPGAEVRTRLRVRNAGSQTGRYRLEVLGDAARWAQVEPRRLAVPPAGEDQVAEVVFRPPHAAAAPDLELAFAVRAQIMEQQDRGARVEGAMDQDVVVEGMIRVTAVPDVVASIEPPAAAGRWGAGYRVRFTPIGRGAVTLRVVAGDPPKALRYAVAPAQVAVAPGVEADVLVSVRPRAPKLVGAPVRHAFAVDHRADTAASAGRLTAVFEQRAVLPTAVFAALTVVAAAVVVGAALLVSGRGPFAVPGAAPAATAAANPNAPAAGPGAAGDPVRGYVALYGPPTPVDDVVSAGRAERFLTQLRAAGVDARIVDSRDSAMLDDGPRGLLAVLRDGFPDRAAAEAECAARRAVAPSCVVLAPR